MRFLGKIRFKENTWLIDSEPHVSLVLKRVFPACKGRSGTLRIPHTLTNAETLSWFRQRYPLEGTEEADTHLFNETGRSVFQKAEADAILTQPLDSPANLKLPLRHYQTQGVYLLNSRKFLLCGDDLGLGKTSIALGGIALGMLPAIIVCKGHLQFQWIEEANKFLDGVVPHMVKKATPYKLPPHNFLVITYSKLSGWVDHLSGYELIAFDEVQELRRDQSNKYSAAKHIASGCTFRYACSASPVYNYGDEMFNILDLIEPGCLGERFEFYQEWCVPHMMHYKVKSPKALGSYLKDSNLFLRRRRHEVGRELPPITRISEEVEYNDKVLFAYEDKALELAQTIISGAFVDRGQASRELSAMLRLQTGLAKAPFVADFVKQLVESGEKVLLGGWHRMVYDTWNRIFSREKIKTVMYTGSESPKQKLESVRQFIDQDADVFIISERSGEGLNGLQTVCSIVVHGELDWSPKVHEQLAGRLHRDDLVAPVTEVFLYTAGGSDPVIAGVLGIKRDQSNGIINPNDNGDTVLDQVEISRGTELAKQILARAKK